MKSAIPLLILPKILISQLICHRKTMSITNRDVRNPLLWVAIFAVAMAYIESAVVVYLRQIFYPRGFDFPLAPLNGQNNMILIELGREAATIVMLTSIGMLAGRSRIEKFAYLLYAFGIWDLFYYVWLKIFIGWPPSLLTWDILFLLPLPWVGPVLAPVLVSLAMIAAAFWIIRRERRGSDNHFPIWAWLCEIAAGLIIILAFIWDFEHITAGGYPHAFRWDIFALGWAGGCALFLYLMVRRQE